MRFRSATVILILALMLLANNASATKCIIYVVDEYNMAVGSARIYIDNSTLPIGMTTYNAGLGRSAWVGDISQLGEHTLTAKWTKTRPNPVLYEGTVTVNIAGNSTMRITIPMHTV
jgi:hypothetical protein